MRILIQFLLILLITSCSAQEAETFVVKGYVFKDASVHYMRRHYKLRIWYNFNYKDSLYQSVKTISKGDPRYFEGDSILIKINKHEPSRNEIIGKIELKNQPIVKLVNPKKRSNNPKSYYIVDEKPLFDTVINPNNNDNALTNYFSKRINDIGIKEEGIVGVGFIVDQNGKVTNAKVRKSHDAFLDTVAIELTKEMPSWKPAKHKNENVRISYLFEVEFKGNADESTK